MDPDEYLVADVIRRIGDDNIVVSTDYPHIDAHFPHALDEFFEDRGAEREQPAKDRDTVRSDELKKDSSPWTTVSRVIGRRLVSEGCFQQLKSWSLLLSV